MTDTKTIYEHVPRGDVFDLLTSLFDNQVYVASGLDIDDANTEDFETNIDIDYSGRAAGVTIEGDSETLAVE